MQTEHAHSGSLANPVGIAVAAGLALTVVGLFIYYGAAWKALARE